MCSFVVDTLLVACKGNLLANFFVSSAKISIERQIDIDNLFGELQVFLH